MRRDEMGRSRDGSSFGIGTLVEEEAGVFKSGHVTMGFAPVKSKKTMYAVLSERALELHESEKSYRKKKPARHLIDLSVAFNVNNDHFDQKLKKCVCLNSPDETLLIKGDSEAQTTEWYDAILSTVIPSRALRLGRPVLPQEFFEYVWDVDIVLQPKLKKPVKNDEHLVNMCSKDPKLQGGKRLCFYAHTIVLCDRRIEPAQSGMPSSGIPPFHTEHFLELPRKFVAFFGCQEKYFLMRMGRSSPMGACELWALCDNEEVALDVHNKLNMIIERESEKKKKMGNGFSPVPSTASLSARPHHRDRSHTQPIRPRTTSIGNASAESEDAVVPRSGGTGESGGGGATGGGASNEAPPQGTPTARRRRALLRDSTALVASFEFELEEAGRCQTASPALSAHLGRHWDRPRPSLGALSAHLAMERPEFARRTGSPASFSGTLHGLPHRKPSTGTPIGGAIIGSGLGNSSPFAGPSMSARAHTMSGMTSSGISGLSNSSPFQLFPTAHRRQSESIEEEGGAGSIYQTMGGHDWSSHTSHHTLRQSPSGGGGAGGGSAGNSTGSGASSSSAVLEETEDSGGTLRLDASQEAERQSLAVIELRPRRGSKDLSTSSEGEERLSVSGAGSCSTGGCSSTQEDSYLRMDSADWRFGSAGHLAVPAQFEQYNIDEARSYVSDSTDSCYSSMAAQAGGGGPGSTVGGPMPPHNQPRAYSFGGRNTLRTSNPLAPSPHHPHTSQAAAAALPEEAIGLIPPPEDPRKRSFSLGAQFLQRPFRKFSQARQQRHSQTSASGASLASSSAGSHGSDRGMSHGCSTLPASTSQAMIGEDSKDRNRSGSFGSGRSTPFTRRGGGVVGSGGGSRDHLVEMDFGGGARLGRSGSGSVASVDSPSRSRTSSFGCSMRNKEAEMLSIFGGTGGLLVGGGGEWIGDDGQMLTPSQQLIMQARRDSHEAEKRQREMEEDCEYVMTDAVNAQQFAAVCVAAGVAPAGGVPAAPSAAPANQHSPPAAALPTNGDMLKPHDARNSQFICETIEENASGRSSRCSSRSSMVAGAGEASSGAVGEGEDDEYTMMDVGMNGAASGVSATPSTATLGSQDGVKEGGAGEGGVGEAVKMTIGPASSAAATATTASGGGRSSHKSSAGSRSSTTSASTSARKEDEVRAERSESSPVGGGGAAAGGQRETAGGAGNAAGGGLASTAGLPKRSSVPVLSRPSNDTEGLTYAFLQHSLEPQRNRSHSGALCERAREEGGVDYTMLKH